MFPILAITAHYLTLAIKIIGVITDWDKTTCSAGGIDCVGIHAPINCHPGHGETPVAKLGSCIDESEPLPLVSMAAVADDSVSVILVCTEIAPAPLATPDANLMIVTYAASQLKLLPLVSMATVTDDSPSVSLVCTVEVASSAPDGNALSVATVLVFNLKKAISPPWHAIACAPQAMVPIVPTVLVLAPTPEVPLSTGLPMCTASFDTEGVAVLVPVVAAPPVASVSIQQ